MHIFIDCHENSFNSYNVKLLINLYTQKRTHPYGIFIAFLFENNPVWSSY